jgi:hypothetical protein
MLGLRLKLELELEWRALGQVVGREVVGLLFRTLR